MKIVLAVFALLCAVQFAASATNPITCVVESTQQIVFNRITATSEWINDFWDTIERLNAYKARCEAISIELFRNLCLSTYDLQVSYEFSRLSNDLKSITDEKLSSLFIEAVRSCVPNFK